MTVKIVRELKEKFDFDVRTVDQPEVIEELIENDQRTLDLLIAALGNQVSDIDDLLLSMGGDEFEAAIWSFIYGCVFFFRSHKQSAILELLNNIREAQKHCGSLMMERVKMDSKELRQKVDDILGESFPS